MIEKKKKKELQEKVHRDTDRDLRGARLFIHTQVIGHRRKTKEQRK